MEYSKPKDPNVNKERAKLRNAMKAAEHNTLEMLVKLFDWLDGLRPQSVTDIVSLYEHSQVIEAAITNALALMNQAGRGENRGANEEITKGVCRKFLTLFASVGRTIRSLNEEHGGMLQ